MQCVITRAQLNDKLITRANFNDIRESPNIKKNVMGQITENGFTFYCGKSFKAKYSMSCEVKNLIYIIRCGGCREEYIGETGDTPRHRVTVYKQEIRDASTRMLYVSGHIDYCARNQQTKFKIWPLYKIQNDNAAARTMKEDYFINLLKPKLNRHT